MHNAVARQKRKVILDTLASHVQKYIIVTVAFNHVHCIFPGKLHANRPQVIEALSVRAAPARGQDRYA